MYYPFRKTMVRNKSVIVVWLAALMALQQVFPLAAMAEEKGARQAKHQQVMTELTSLRGDVGNLYAGIDRIAFIQGEMLASVCKMEKTQDQIDARVKALCEGDQALEIVLTDVIAKAKILQERVCAAAGKIEEHNQELCELQCSIRQLVCCMNTLPGKIRRAKIRAFIFGFLVGMGVSFAIGGAGGGAGIVSAGVW